ncbi:MAG: helix-turn-helix domain-containing protein [Polyangiaceae bacterium]
MKPAALHALADAAEALARLAREAASERPEAWGDALIPIAEAARLAATSPRVVREAIRRGELAAFGRMRDRAVRDADLAAWIASRALDPVEGVDDADIARRVNRLAQRKRRRAAGTVD